MAKIMYLDTETTGAKAGFHDLIQLALIIEIDGVEKESYQSIICPIRPGNADPEALKVHGMSIDHLQKKGIDPRLAFYRLLQIIDKYVNRFDRKDKFFIAGYNTHFDVSFLRAFWKDNGDNFFGAWFHPYQIDAYALCCALAPRIFPVNGWQNIKLSTVCQAAGIPLDNAHDAMADIKATKKLTEMLLSDFYTPIALMPR